MPIIYKQQIIFLKKILGDQTYGIERLFRLFLCLVLYLYPTLLIRTIFRRFGEIPRKLAVETYMLLKLLFPVYVLVTGLYHHAFIVFLIIYLLSETMFNVLNLIFLSDIYDLTISYTRSLLFLFIHYLEVVFDFSVLYLAFDMFNKALSPLTAVYVSFVVNTTLGFGDYVPKNSLGQVVVMAQLTIFIMFVIVFVNHFTSQSSSKK